MKANVKQRQQIARDTKAAEIMTWYMLYGLHESEGYGTTRLQRVYDSMMLEMWKDSHDEMAYYFIEGFAREHKLTPEGFAERQAGALEEFEQRKEPYQCHKKW